MTKDLNIISKKLSEIIEYYYTFRAINTTISNSSICKKCNTSLLRDKLSTFEKNTILDIILNNLAQKNPYFIKYIEELNSSIHSKKSKFNVDYILDGANIGFFKQRPDKGGKLSFVNIQKIVDFIKTKNKKLIIFLHEKHLNKRFLSTKNLKIVENWEKEGILYKTHRGLNDDWYWLYLGVYLEKCFIISNDRMCDHYFQCFHDKSFKRWRDMTKIEFNFNYNQIVLSNIDASQNGSLINELKIHIPYYKTPTKIHWLCIDN